MFVTVNGDDEAMVVYDINEETGAVVIFSGEGTVEEEAVRVAAGGTSFGPPPWLGPYQVIREWALACGWGIDPADTPPLPSLDPGDVN